MALTRSEKLLNRVGNLELCDNCLKEYPFNRGWMMTSKKEVICPECQNAVLKRGGLLVSI